MSSLVCIRKQSNRRTQCHQYCFDWWKDIETHGLITKVHHLYGILKKIYYFFITTQLIDYSFPCLIVEKPLNIFIGPLTVLQFYNWIYFWSKLIYKCTPKSDLLSRQTLHITSHSILILRWRSGNYLSCFLLPRSFINKAIRRKDGCRFLSPWEAVIIACWLTIYWCLASSLSREFVICLLSLMVSANYLSLG